MDMEGIEALSPKKALLVAYQLGWLSDEEAWLKMLNDRNLTSHTYREEYALEIYSRLPRHFESMQQLEQRIKTILCDK